MNLSDLKAFFADKAARVAWAEFIMEIFDKEALERVYRGEDTSHIKEARDIVSRAFKELDELFEKKRAKQPVDRAV